PCRCAAQRVVLLAGATTVTYPTDDQSAGAPQSLYGADLCGGSGNPCGGDDQRAKPSGLHVDAAAETETDAARRCRSAILAVAAAQVRRSGCTRGSVG